MSETPSNKPTDAELSEALETLTNLKTEIETYQDAASAIDEEFKQNHESQHLSLDDLPYGEELVRTGESLKDLDRGAAFLAKCVFKNLGTANSEQFFNDALSLIEEARSTLDDCKKLPSETVD